MVLVDKENENIQDREKEIEELMNEKGWTFLLALASYRLSAEDFSRSAINIFVAQTGYQDDDTVNTVTRALGKSEGNFYVAAFFIFKHHYTGLEKDDVIREALKASNLNFEKAHLKYQMILQIMDQTGYTDAVVIREALEASEWNNQLAQMILQIMVQTGYTDAVVVRGASGSK